MAMRVSTGGMVPSSGLLVPVRAGGLIRADGRPGPELRDQLRRIASYRNAGSVASLWLQTVGLVVAAAWIGHPLAWVAVFILFARSHAQFAALMHEAAHRLLFRNRTLNDWAGRWLVGYPAFTGPDAYRRGHMAHHREEFGPDEPDMALYRDYPITSDSFWRKLVRDATGQTGLKLMRALLGNLRSPDKRSRRTVWSILAAQVVLLAVCIVAGVWWVYLLWLGSHLTGWRVINRLRAIAEHGGMHASPDRRETTHSVRQSWPARFMLVPYHIGWHLAHHADSGVPWRNLPRYHQALIDAGYVTEGLEHPSYHALWRKLASRSPDVAQ
jgi:fatty acid desaturase